MNKYFFLYRYDYNNLSDVSVMKTFFENVCNTQQTLVFNAIYKIQLGMVEL